ncbi:DUF2933 domain-containing protein [Paralcaligenes ureilyticus]|uniref:DUF2933 family protein n=1 Tax=Paralcaligenes ureilyticus TaxID=627131 RepID=A0A4R3M2W8_9BURK|nr:DUF2933 domain-containing protein [Paralcaligenes ureilyticus]TCT07066.1 DUF2933 family protein [Paralcaligenes ureilyticus]
MMKTSLGLGVVIAVAYATLPVAREWIAVSAPFLFFLMCPLMMAFMMKAMPSCEKELSVEKDKTYKTPSKPLYGPSRH